MKEIAIWALQHWFELGALFLLWLNVIATEQAANRISNTIRYYR